MEGMSISKWKLEPSRFTATILCYSENYDIMAELYYKLRHMRSYGSR